MKIVTTFVYPPIPTRECDYSAIDDSTYDGEGCLIGRGRTAEAAIQDLAEQWAMKDDIDEQHLGHEAFLALSRGDVVTLNFIDEVCRQIA